MAGLKKVEGYDEYVINICPNDTGGEVVEIGGINIQLPELPKEEEILNHGYNLDMQMWKRLPVP